MLLPSLHLGVPLSWADLSLPHQRADRSAQRRSAEAPPYSVLKLSLLAAAVFIVVMALSVLIWSFIEAKPPLDPQRPVDPFSTPEWKAFQEKAHDDIQKLREQRDRER